MADDVQLTDLEVIQRYSLAVRGATADREALVAALQSDLEWLRGGRRARPVAKVPAAPTGRAALGAPAKRAAKAAPSRVASKRTPSA